MRNWLNRFLEHDLVRSFLIGSLIIGVVWLLVHATDAESKMFKDFPTVHEVDTQEFIFLMQASGDSDEMPVKQDFHEIECNRFWGVTPNMVASGEAAEILEADHPFEMNDCLLVYLEDDKRYILFMIELLEE